MRFNPKGKSGIFGAVLLAATLAVFTGVTLAAYANSVTYGGQGLIADGFGGYDLVTEICGVANGADADGPYLLWVLTATGAKNAAITGPWGTATMTKFGAGTFKYVSGWYAPSTLPGSVSATYDGKVKNAQLTISHGCRPFTHSAWCSPGFWGHAEAGAWALINIDKTTATFGTTVDIDANYTPDTLKTQPDAALLTTILANPSTYSGPAIGAFYGWSANAFNLTGAWLTNQIPGYTFDPTFTTLDDSQTCPIDHFGNFKNPQ
jgi:hypothetical protein